MECSMYVLTSEYDFTLGRRNSVKWARHRTYSGDMRADPGPRGSRQGAAQPGHAGHRSSNSWAARLNTKTTHKQLACLALATFVAP